MSEPPRDPDAPSLAGDEAAPPAAPQPSGRVGPLKLGLVGPGRHADRRIMPALRAWEGAKVWRVLGREPDAAANFSERHAIEGPVAATLDELLADDALEAVILTSPASVHVAQLVASIRAGKVVFVANPVALDREGARAVEAALAQASAPIAVGRPLRWHPGHRLLASRIKEGAYGALERVRVLVTGRRREGEPEVRSEAGGDGNAPGGLLDLEAWSLATRGLDVVCGLLGDGVLDRLRLEHLETPGASDRAASTRTWTGSLGTAGRLELCVSTAFQAPSRVEIYGTEGYAVCEGTLGDAGQGSIETSRGPLVFPSADPYALDLRAFLAGCRLKPAPSIDARAPSLEVLTSLRIVDALCRGPGPEAAPESGLEGLPRTEKKERARSERARGRAGRGARGDAPDPTPA